MYHKHFVRAIFKDHSQDKDFAMVFGTAVNEGLDRYLAESTDEVVLTTYTTSEGHFVYESELHADALEKDADKLAWFVGKTLFNESLLCRTCWQGQFNKLTERERKEWGFYDNKKPR